MNISISFAGRVIIRALRFFLPLQQDNRFWPCGIKDIVRMSTTFLKMLLSGAAQSITWRFGHEVHEISVDSAYCLCNRRR